MIDPAPILAAVQAKWGHDVARRLRDDVAAKMQMANISGVAIALDEDYAPALTSCILTVALLAAAVGIETKDSSTAEVSAAYRILADMAAVDAEFEALSVP